MRTTIGVVLALGALLGAREAHACGGFFCNANVPVNQTGERILFAVEDDGRLVTYVQVQYEGAPENFSWVVPVRGVPEVEAGTDAVFAVLEATTMPRFGLETCVSTASSSDAGCSAAGDARPLAHGLVRGPGCGGDTSDCSSGLGWESAGGFAPVDPPDVLGAGDAGPFTYTIVNAGHEDILFAWLSTRGYTVTPQGQQLLRTYLAEGYNFLAVRLNPTRTVGDVRPLVLRSDEPQPCIPLRLTAVAAQQDMPVRAWVLGPRRAVPQGFLHVEINEARIDWDSGGANYEQLVSEAVDQAPGGLAFTTDFAGPTGFLRGAVWPGQGYSFDDVDPRRPGVLASLPQNAVLAAIQERWAADGTSEEEARAELEAEVLAPLRKAQELLDSRPYLTRLYTRISPQEMLDDPLFTWTDQMPDVPAERIARDAASCEGGPDAELVLPEGRRLVHTQVHSAAEAHEAGPAAIRLDRFDHLGRRSMVADHAAEVPDRIEVGAGGCAAFGRAGGRMAWLGLALAGLAAMRLRRARPRTRP